MSAGAWLPAGSTSTTCSAKPTGPRGVHEKRLRRCARSALQPAVTLEPRRAPRRPRPGGVDHEGGGRWTVKFCAG